MLRTGRINSSAQSTRHTARRFMKQCKQCQSSFEVLDADRDFYKMMQVPEPTFCYLCRMQRRLTYRSERFLYHRKCDLSGKQIISTYSTDKPFPVYANSEWWSDKWDPRDYGRDFDFSRPFFEQFFELRNDVPRLNLIQQEPMENSDYCNAAGKCKNCYLCFSSNGNEDCYFCTWINYCKNCLDCFSINLSELCYECVGCRDCYNLKYSSDSVGCKNSAFLRNCQSCTDCFGCTNLRGKQYYIFNKPHTKESYEAFMKQVDLGSYQVVSNMKERFHEVVNDMVVKEFEGVNNQNSLGNYIRNNKNAYLCFEVENCEDTRYSICLFKAKNSMDHSHWGDGTENVYECQAVGYGSSNIRFSNLCTISSSDLTYCDHCFTSRNCFASVGLKKNEYCILNKQYSKEAYEALVPKIIEHMKKTGEWGEFFPSKFSPYAYNESLAYEQIPLSREEVLARGWGWHDEQREKTYKGSPYKIPDHIKDVDDDILDSILVSEKSGIPYKIIPQELKFYKEKNIPIPRITPDERHWERLKKRNPRILWDRHCEQCQKTIKTSYSPERPEKVYCEDCYLKNIY